jgi:single-strand DNA-binding protein
MNTITLWGHVGKDSESKFTANGSQVLTFSLATKESWHDDKGEKHEKTEWHRCVAWRKLAEALDPYAKKGAPLIIIGRNETRSWEKDGKKYYSTEIQVKYAGVPIMAGNMKSEKPKSEQPDPDYQPNW